MTIEIREFDQAKEAILFLEDLAFGRENYIFRGQDDNRYRLETTYARFLSQPFIEGDDLDELIRKFQVGLIKIGRNPIEEGNKQDWLEYARHYGVPTPCLDFTYSPYIALFFSFNELKGDVEENESVMVSAINLNHIAAAWAAQQFDSQTQADEFRQCYEAFFHPHEQFFNQDYPSQILQFIPFPSRFNTRMQRQQGAFLYDTLNYPVPCRNNPSLCYQDLEDFIDHIQEPDLIHPDSERSTKQPTMTKVWIKRKCITDVFMRLELMGITGGTLYNDAEGVVMDIFNQYHYKSKTYYLRDVNF